MCSYTFSVTQVQGGANSRNWREGADGWEDGIGQRAASHDGSMVSVPPLHVTGLATLGCRRHREPKLDRSAHKTTRPHLHHASIAQAGFRSKVRSRLATHALFDVVVISQDGPRSCYARRHTVVVPKHAHN